MKKIFYILIVLLMINTLSAQNKKLTLYYPDSTRVINISGLDSMTIFICGASKVNYGGKDYNTVLIGNQCWLKENLDIGSMITGWPANNSTIEKYCYNNLLSNCETYGGLYMWDEAMGYSTTPATKGICPVGWHIPTNSEYQDLITAVGGDGNSLKREDQGIGAGVGTNISGFSALLAGGKGYSGGPYYYLNEFGTMWTSIGSSGYASYFRVDYNNSSAYQGSGAMVSWGYSIRCLKD